MSVDSTGGIARATARHRGQRLLCVTGQAANESALVAADESEIGVQSVAALQKSDIAEACCELSLMEVRKYE